MRDHVSQTLYLLFVPVCAAFNFGRGPRNGAAPSSVDETQQHGLRPSYFRHHP